MTAGVREPRVRPRAGTGRALNAAEAPGAGALPLERAAEVLPADLIHDDEVIILLLRPSILFIPLSALGSLAFIAIVAFMLAWMGRLGWFFWSDTTAFALGAGLAALRLGWQTLEWYCRVYVLTDRRIIRRMGVLRVAVFETSLSSIQHTSVFQLLRERVVGLGTIGFATAGSDTFEAFWTTIARPFAVHKTVVDAINRYGGNRRV
ncbi:MAG: PH domain-containing protein [Planctomycetota bacterium]